MRSPVDSIRAPSFPQDLGWVNVAPLRIEKQARQPLLICFWDVCGPGSLRTLRYLGAWHERYAQRGLRVIGVHSSSLDAGNEETAARAAVERLGIGFPVALDPQFRLWRTYDNPGWPARYLFAPRLRLYEVHHGEGDYEGTERAIQELLGIDEPPIPLLDPTDDDDAEIVVPTTAVEGAFQGPYGAGEVWIVVDGPGVVTVNGAAHELDRVGAHRVIRHERHAAGELHVEAAPGVQVLRTAFMPGLA